MILLPASAGLAANAGTGPEGHKRSSSVDSGASSDATMVASDVDWIDGTDMGAVDGCHKLVAIEKGPASPSERLPKCVTGVHNPEALDAQRGRVSTDTASGAPALATHTMTAGLPTTAAPTTVSISTATALAVAGPYVDALNEPSEASDAGHHEAAPADSASAAAARDAAAAATASSAGSEVAIAPGTPAPASSAIVDRRGLAPASASATAGEASALGAAACESATIVANETSRGDAACPETPVIWRLFVPRAHVVAPADLVAAQISVIAVGRRSSPASTAPTAPGATFAALLVSATPLHGSGAIACLTTVESPALAADDDKPNTLDAGSKSAVIVANATSRVHANCPSTPVVSRLPAARAHVIPGTAVPTVPVNGFECNAFAIGRRSSAPSTAPPAIALATATVTAPADPPVLTAALPPMLATALSPTQPPSSPARFGVLRAVSRVIQRAMDAIQNALIGLYTDGIGSKKREHSTWPGLPDGDGCWDEGAPVDAALLELRKRQRRRFL